MPLEIMKGFSELKNDGNFLKDISYARKRDFTGMMIHLDFF